MDILHAAENIEELTELIPTITTVTSAECRMYAGSGRWTSDCRMSSQSSPQEGLILPVQLIQQKSTASDNALYLECTQYSALIGDQNDLSDDNLPNMGYGRQGSQRP